MRSLARWGLPRGGAGREQISAVAHILWNKTKKVKQQSVRYYIFTIRGLQDWRVTSDEFLYSLIDYVNISYFRSTDADVLGKATVRRLLQQLGASDMGDDR